MKNKIIGVLMSFVLIPNLLGGITKDNLLNGIIYHFLPKRINIEQENLNSLNEWKDRGSHKYILSHRQTLWIAVLELCESGGYQNALNPSDIDKTPSYSWFQFKPDTVKRYTLKYELIDKEIAETYTKEDWINWAHDYNFIKEIVTRMIGDPDVVWRKVIKDKNGGLKVIGEFPECVRKWGHPKK